MEKRNLKKLPHQKHFISAITKNAIVASSVVAFSLFMGAAGYRYYFDLPWIDSLLNASMILTGMGPVDVARTDGAKLFASIYAIYSGVAFLTSIAVLFAPVLHRFLHKFHLDVEE